MLIIVRGGLMTPDLVARNARADVSDGYAARLGLVWPVSVCAAAPNGGEDRAATICRIATMGRIRNGQVRVSNEERVVRAGFRLVHTPDDPDGEDTCEAHYDIDLGTIEDLVAIERLVSLFDEPERNPCPWKD